MNHPRSEHATAPLYCARCRRVGEGDERVCQKCGDALLPQGYCTVCEDWALAGPGQVCPKHDLELLDRPDESENAGSSARLVTIASYSVPSQAHGPRLRLEAEGIPVFLQGERMGDNAIYSVATGGVKLQVPEPFVGDARVLLSQTWTSPEKPEELDPDDPWEGLGPEPAERRRSVMKLAILIFLLWPLVFVLIGAVLAWVAALGGPR
jgi:hypothetical protein